MSGLKDSSNPRNYSDSEMLACTAARLLEDKKSVFVGTGLPMIATILAQKLYAPNMLIMFEAGGVGPMVPQLPISVGDSRTFYKAILATSMTDVMSLSMAGYTDYGFLGAAQIDMYGNINTTVIGSHDRPTVRLPGSGGANDVGSCCHRTIIVMRQTTRGFVDKLDFLTTPGYLTGPGAREQAGLPAGSGPYRLVTQLAVYGFNDTSKRTTLLSLSPGVTVEQIQQNSQFEILIPDQVGNNLPPTEAELRLIRTEIDPARMVIGK